MRRWIAPLAVACAFGLLLFYVLREPAPQIGKEEPAGEPILTLAADEIDQVKVKGEEELVVERKPEGGFTWWLEPQHLPANQLKVNQLVDWATGLEGVPVGEGRSLAPFGLARPAWEIELYRRGERVARILVGTAVPVQETSFEKRFYAMVQGNPKVYVVSGWVIEELGGGVGEWRERYLMELPIADLTVAELSWGGQAVRVKKVGDRWQVSSTRQQELDTEKIRPFLQQLTMLEAQEFVNDQPSAAELAAYGLNRPWLRGVAATATVRRELLVGNRLTKEDKEYRYAKLAHRPWVFLLETKALEEVRQAAQELGK